MKEIRFYEDLLELSQIKVDGVEKTTTKIILHCHQATSEEGYPHCLQPSSQVHQYTSRQVRDLHILGKEVWLHIRVKQYLCEACNRYFSEHFSFVESNKSYTKRQAK
ncbi:MAG: transposase family protein [Phycisphaerae bacterium]|nr:transposase family protein [Saprospiraceae bacterium]